MNPSQRRGGLGSAPASNPGRNQGGEPVVEKFPSGLRVLVVDDDPTCLKILEKMLINCLYEVTGCNRAEKALTLLRKHKHGFDIVISDVHMPDMDGFKLLEHVGLEMDLPVIMMSADDSKSVVLKGVTHGAVDYLIKPVRMEALKNIWQHVVRKRKTEWSLPELSGSIEQQRGCNNGEDAAEDNSSSVNEGRSLKKRKDEDGDEDGDDDDASNLKKPRVVWSVDLHQQFVAAVNQLGVEKAVPKKILELMNVPGLTRENVASHLQKYRIYLRRLGGVSSHQGNLSNSFMTGPDASFGPLSTLNGFDLQSLAQLQATSLGRPPGALVSKPGLPVDFSFDYTNTRFSDGVVGHHGQQRQPPPQMRSLLHGVPTGMEPKQLAGSLQQLPMGSNGISIQQQIAAARNGGMLTPLAGQQPFPRGPPSMLSNSIPERSGFSGRNNNIPESSRVLPTGYASLSTAPQQQHSSNSIAFNTFPLASAPGLSVPVRQQTPSSYQEEANSSEAAGFAAPNHGFSTNGQNDWDLGNIGIAFGAHQDAFSAPEAYSSSSSSMPGNNNGIVRPHRAYVADGSVRVKSERVATDMAFREQYSSNQEDLMSALLKQEGIAPVDGEFDPSAIFRFDFVQKSR